VITVNGRPAHGTRSGNTESIPVTGGGNYQLQVVNG
jgi:hypothetical protein